MIDPLKIQDWERNISKSEKGEVGRVYFINCKAIFPDGNEWTRHWPITLNPDHGSTVEEMVKRHDEIPGPMKSELLSHRRAEARLSSGLVYRLWVSDSPAPDSWGAEKQVKPILFDQNGNPMTGVH